MRSFLKPLAPLLLAAALAFPMALTTGCGNNNDDPQYVQWEHETHREHQDFNKRSDPDKREYQDWRQKHGQH
jgi:hypothetical protein